MKQQCALKGGLSRRGFLKLTGAAGAARRFRGVGLTFPPMQAIIRLPGSTARRRCSQGETPMRNNRQGCLQGLLEIFLINALFDWLQKRFGFGRGASCSGCGCGLVLALIFLALLCGVIGGTDWFSVF